MASSHNGPLGAAESPVLYGGLLLYAFVNTLLPSLLLRVGLDESTADPATGVSSGVTGDRTTVAQ